MDWEKFGRLVRDVGFPIGVALYLLVRLDYLLREHTAAIWTLVHAVDKLAR